MLEIQKLKPEASVGIAIDCLNTFMKANGKLSISAYQNAVKGRSQEEVQREIDNMAKRTGDFRKFLFGWNVPQIQFQDAHVIESIHGKRFHSLEIVREGQSPDFIRTFPPHALLDQNRRFGMEDQQNIQEIELPSKKVYIHWFDTTMPVNACVEPKTELFFMKDDFCMSPGSPHINSLFWELRRQGRFYLIVFGVCDEICNLRNVLLMLSAIFNVIYIEDCTFPLDPEKRNTAIEYMKNFNPLGEGKTGSFMSTTSLEFMKQFCK
ncbi:MAG: isochorismatase family protein [Candidatus Brocadiae bacterium]|nr:isochorismatase family protein [Candidatus Brocadiia bacterium]